MSIYLKRVKYTLIIGWLVIAAGLLDIIGWQFGIGSLRSILPGITPMNPVSAVTLTICGIWLLVYYLAPRRTVALRLMEVFILVVGAFHFFPYLFPGLSGLRFDYALYGDKIKANHMMNLIAPNTALAFLLDGFAMTLTTSRRRYKEVVRQLLVIISFSLVYISLVGYIYNVQPAYKFEHFTPMALYTALVFLLLNTGLFLSNAHYGLAKTFISRLSGGELIRWAIPFILGLPLLIGCARLYGERHGLLSAEYSKALDSLVFTLSVFIFISGYAAQQNNRQRIRAERELAQSEKKFRTLFDTLKEGVATTNLTGNILYCNTGFCKIVGYTEAELSGRNAITLLIPKTEQIAFYRSLTGETAAREDDHKIQIIKKGGEKIWISLKVSPVNNAEDETETFLITVADITRERLQLQDLQAFTASAAHDLHAPLARIAMVVNIFETGNLTDEQKMLIAAIDDTSAAMRQLLQDLLTFSKLGAGQLEKTRLNLDEIVTEVCDTETPEAFAGEIAINVLPAVTGNEAVIRQLYTNLISNAIKYSAKKEQPKIEIGAYENRNRMVYYVTDNGTGLNEHQVQNLFVPFRRFHFDVPGNGMGLAIVKRIVEKHGGKIWVASIEGEGTTFNFTLSPDLEGRGHAEEDMSEAA